MPRPRRGRSDGRGSVHAAELHPAAVPDRPAAGVGFGRSEHRCAATAVERGAFRPLETEEVELCRSIALADPRGRRPVAWALCEATARTGELSPVRRCDVDLAQGRVRLPGTAHVDARWGVLTAWGTAQLERPPRSPPGRSGDAGAAEPARRTRTFPLASAQHVIDEVLTRAGLHHTDGVKPSSIAGWAGGRLFDETGRIDLVAARCGVRSLDSAARLIGWDWRLGDGVTRRRGVSALERLEAILANPEIHLLAAAVPTPDPTMGGRPRQYPVFMAIVYEAAISVYGSARQVEAELAHPLMWRWIRRQILRRHGIRLPRAPMRRHHYLYLRNTYLDPPASPRPARRDPPPGRGGPGPPDRAPRPRRVPDRGPSPAWTGSSTATARSSPRCSTPGPARPGSTAAPARSSGSGANPTPASHFEGSGEAAWGTKFVLLATRGARRPRPDPPRRRPRHHPRRRSRRRHGLPQPHRTARPRRSRCHLRHRPARGAPPADPPRPRAPAHQPGRRRKQLTRQPRATGPAAAHREDRVRRTTNHHPPRRHDPNPRPLRESRGHRTRSPQHRRAPPLHAAPPRPHPPQRRTRPPTAGTTTTASPPTSAVGSSPSGSTATPPTKPASFNRAENVRPIPPDDPDLQGASSAAATTPSRSTEGSTTASGSAGPTASATTANTSTCSATPSW